MPPDFTGKWVAVGYPSPGHPARVNVQQAADRLIIEIPGGATPTERFVVELEPTDAAPAPGISLPATPPPPTSSTARWRDGALTIILIPTEGEPSRQQAWSLVGDELRVRSFGSQMRTIGGVSGTVIARQITRYKKDGS
jgi:hypothetical protein